VKLPVMTARCQGAQRKATLAQHMKWQVPAVQVEVAPGETVSALHIKFLLRHYCAVEQI